MAHTGLRSYLLRWCCHPRYVSPAASGPVCLLLNWAIWRRQCRGRNRTRMNLEVSEITTKNILGKNAGGAFSRNRNGLCQYCKSKHIRNPACLDCQPIHQWDVGSRRGESKNERERERERDAVIEWDSLRRTRKQSKYTSIIIITMIWNESRAAVYKQTKEYLYCMQGPTHAITWTMELSSSVTR